MQQHNKKRYVYCIGIWTAALKHSFASWYEMNIRPGYLKRENVTLNGDNKNWNNDQDASGGICI